MLHWTPIGLGQCHCHDLAFCFVDANHVRQHTTFLCLRASPVACKPCSVLQVNSDMDMSAINAACQHLCCEGVWQELVATIGCQAVHELLTKSSIFCKQADAYLQVCGRPVTNAAFKRQAVCFAHVQLMNGRSVAAQGLLGRPLNNQCMVIRIFVWTIYLFVCTKTVFPVAPS
jgi:hypothetical protein